MSAPIAALPLVVDGDACRSYGALTEGVHVAGYTIERAWKNLEWLLTDDRWQRLGVPFKDVNAFLDSIKLDNLRIVADQRKRIADRIRQLQPQASNRAIGRALGVDHKTINNDARGENSPLTQPRAREAATSRSGAGENSPLSGAQVAALAEKAQTKDERQQAKRERRDARERELAAKQLSLPDRKFNVVVEDYEWDFEVYSRETGMDRHAANHYPVSVDAHTAEEIVERTRDRFVCAADDCVLFMWATVPFLAIAIDVLRQRGFRYVSNHAWGKDRIGTGLWNRNKHEHFLIGVRGDIPAPAPGTQWESLIMSDVGEHSAKPECFLAMVESYYPNLPKIELNRRGPPRPGWWAWGYEAEAADD